jgi:hypothetical protein
MSRNLLRLRGSGNGRIEKQRNLDPLALLSPPIFIVSGRRNAT